MTVTQTFNLGGFPDGAVDVPAAPPAAPSPSNTLLVNPRFGGAFGVALALPTNVQRAQFIGFAARDYAASEVFPTAWEITVAAVGVVFAEVGLMKQLNAYAIGVDPVCNVVAFADVSVDIVAAPGSYVASLPISAAPAESIARGDPLWIVWAVTTTVTPPTFRSVLADSMAPTSGGNSLVAWQPSLEIGAPGTTFLLDTVPPIRTLTVPPLP